MAHPVKNISTAGVERNVNQEHTGFFSHQPMVPCTPPEFLKMASHPPTRPPCPAYMHCVFVPEWALLYLFTTGTRNHNSPGLPDLVKSHYIEAVFMQLVSPPHMYCKWLAERKTPLCGLYAPEPSCEIKPETVVEMVVLHKIWGCDHTYNLFNLLTDHAASGRNTLFSFASSLWIFINDKTVHGEYKFKRNL